MLANRGLLFRCFWLLFFLSLQFRTVRRGGDWGTEHLDVNNETQGRRYKTLKRHEDWFKQHGLAPSSQLPRASVQEGGELANVSPAVSSEGEQDQETPKDSSNNVASSEEVASEDEGNDGSFQDDEDDDDDSSMDWESESEAMKRRQATQGTVIGPTKFKSEVNPSFVDDSTFLHGCKHFDLKGLNSDCGLARNCYLHELGDNGFLGRNGITECPGCSKVKFDMNLKEVLGKCIFLCKVAQRHGTKRAKGYDKKCLCVLCPACVMRSSGRGRRSCRG